MNPVRTERDRRQELRSGAHKVSPKTSLTGTHWLVLVSSVAWGCAANGDEVQPPADELFFPSSLATSVDGSHLFVVNANAELRYDSGSIAVIDLASMAGVVDSWVDFGEVPSAADCDVGSANPIELECDESAFLRPDAGVRIGNFATDIAVQELSDGSSRLFVAVRGDPSLTWVDFDPNTNELACGGSGAVPACDDEHRLIRLRGDDALGFLPNEPFGLFVDSGNGYVVAAHLSFSAVSLAEAPSNGDVPHLSDAIGNVFGSLRSDGAADVAGRTPGAIDNRIYVTSNSQPRVQLFTVARLNGELTLIPADFFLLSDLSPADDSRGIVFSQGGDRAFVVNRDPPMVVAIRTADNDEGVPSNEIEFGIEICSDAANLTVADFGRGERVVVTCFRAGQIWVVDPAARRVDAVIEVGRGPQAVAISEAFRQVYVSNYLEDTLAVVDVEPGSNTEYRVVLRVGRPKQTEGSAQ